MYVCVCAASALKAHTDGWAPVDARSRTGVYSACQGVQDGARRRGDTVEIENEDLMPSEMLMCNNEMRRSSVSPLCAQ